MNTHTDSGMNRDEIRSLALRALDACDRAAELGPDASTGISLVAELAHAVLEILEELVAIEAELRYATEPVYPLPSPKGSPDAFNPGPVV